MLIKTKRCLSLVLVLTIAVSLAACGGSAPPASSAAPASSGEAAPPPVSKEVISLKFAHGDPDNTPDGQTILLLADKIKEHSGGGMEIVVYGGEQLGTISTMQEGVQLGTIDITLSPDNTFSAYSPTLFGIASIPYLFQDNEAFSRLILETGLSQKQADLLLENGMVLLNDQRNYFKGPYRVICSKTPIETLDDFKGLRFRAFENKQYIAVYEKLGANPLVVPWGETFSALQQGIVDACAGNMSQIRGMGFTEQAPYVIRTNEYYSNIIFVMNAKKWDSLGPEYQQILRDCANEAFSDLQRLQKESLDEDIKWMEENQNAVFTTLDTAPIREALKDYYIELEEEGILPAGTVEAAFAKQ